MIIKTYKIDADDEGQRLDRWLKKSCPQVPFSLLQKLLRTGQIRLDGKRVKTDQKLLAGQVLRIPLQEDVLQSDPGELSAQDLKIAKSMLVYEDESLIALNKPSGLATQGGSGVIRHVDGLLAAYAKNPKKKPKLVHRLDRETSGILIAAKTTTVATQLGVLFAERSIRKIYLALCSPVPEIHAGMIEAKLKKGLSGQAMERMLIAPDGQDAQTQYQVLETTPQAALIAFYPRTGRTHQIRVHAAHAGFPLLGDDKYKGKKAERLCLHAALLEFPHPHSGDAMVFRAQIPDDMKKIAQKLGLALPDDSRLSKLFVQGKNRR